MEIAIIDYGVGNLRSANKALEYVAPETKVRVTRDPDRVKGADYIVLRGMVPMPIVAIPCGFTGMIDSLYQAVWQDKKPFLGICVGMQLMASVGWEYGETKGLDWIAGDVVALKPRDPRLRSRIWVGIAWSILNRIPSLLTLPKAVSSISSIAIISSPQKMKIA